MTKLKIGVVISSALLAQMPGSATAASIGEDKASPSSFGDSRCVPREGAIFRVESNTKITSDGQIRDEMFIDVERRVTASDGLIATTSNTMEGVKGGATDHLTPDGKKAFLTATSDGATTTYRYFLLVDSTSVVFPTPAAPDGAFTGAAAGKRITTSLKCDWSELASFFPIGKTQKISMPCTEETTSFEGALIERVSMITLAYEGESQAHTKAGDFAVRNIRITTEYLDNSSKESLILFSERLCFPVLSDTTANSAPFGGQVMTTHAELVRFD